MNRIIGSLLGGLFGLLVGPVMAQPTVTAADWCPIMQVNAGQSPPTGSFLTWPTDVGATRFWCAGQLLQSPGGFFSLSVNPNSGELDAVYGNDPNDIYWRFTRGGVSGPVVNGASYYLVLGRPADNQVSLRGYYVQDPGIPVEWSTVNPPYLFSVDPGGGAFIQVLDDQINLGKGVPNGTTPIPGAMLFGPSIRRDGAVSFQLEELNYMLDKASFSIGEPASGASTRCTNHSNIPVTCALTLSFSYQSTNSFQWGFKEGLRVTAGGGVSIPFLADAKVGIEISLEANQTWTESKSNTQTQTLTFSFSAPPHSVYSVQINALKYTANLPYVATGVGTYRSGKTKNIQVPGIWTGSSTFKFEAAASCISAPPRAAPQRQRRHLSKRHPLACSCPLIDKQVDAKIGPLMAAQGHLRPS